MTAAAPGPKERSGLPPNLRSRILAALQLAPMTSPELAKCLCASVKGISEALSALQRRGLTEPAGWRRVSRRRASHIWRAAAPRQTGLAHG